MHFLDSEESIINLILNKSIDSLLSYNYLIITSYNNSKNVFESLLFQAFYINKSDYISIIKFINNNYDKNLNMSINFYYDNSKFLIPNKYIFYSKYIPLFSILLLLLINKIFFKVNIYYNICFNSAILRIICSLIYISLILEKLKYNKIKYEYMSSASIDYLNNFINDIYLSFIITSMIFIINNEINIINFFNSEDRKIKIYFLIFLLLSLINIPNYLYIKSKIIFHIFDILQIKLVLYEIFKVIISIYFINKQIKTISKILYIYSIYHLVINIYFLKAKKVFLYLMKYLIIIILLFNYIIGNIIFKRYKNNVYYWNMISKCIIENYNSFIIFLFWIILNINEDNNPILHLFLQKNNYNKVLKCYKFRNDNIITDSNYSKLKDNFNILNNPIIIFNPYINQIYNDNFEKINIGVIN